MAVAHVRSETRGVGKRAYRSESSRNTRPDRLCSERSSEMLIWMGWVGSFVHDKDDGRNRVLNVVLMRVLYGPLHGYGCYVTPIDSSLSINVAVKRGWVVEWVVVRWREGQPFRTPFPHSWTGLIDFLLKGVRASNQFVDADIPRSATCRMIYIYMHVDLYVYGQILQRGPAGDGEDQHPQALARRHLARDH